MRKILTIAFGMVALLSYATVPFRMAAPGTLPEFNSKTVRTAKVGSVPMKAMQKAEEEEQFPEWNYGSPIYEIPEGGTYKLYRRSCNIFYSDWSGELNLGADDYFAGEVVFYDNGDVYMRNMMPSMVSGSYLKGKYEGNKITLDFPQVLCPENPYYDDEGHLVTDGFWPVFRADYDLDMEKGTVDVWVDLDRLSMTFTIHEDGSITQDDDCMLGVFTQGGIWYGESAWKLKYTPFEDKPQTMPEGLKTEKWALATADNAYLTEMAFDGNTVYWKGLYGNMKDAVVKGVVDGNKVRFESPVYIGIDPGTSHLAYFCGTKTVNNMLQITDEAALSYDAEKGEMGFNRKYLIINAGNEIPNLIAQFYSPKLYRQSENPVYAKPAVPEVKWVDDWMFDPWVGLNSWYAVINIPNIDVNGNLLDVDRMWYNIFFDDELYWFDAEDYGLVDDSPDVPYTYDDATNIFCRGSEHHIYFYWTGWKKMGVQSVFEDNEGNVYRSDLVEYGDLNAINTAETEKNVASIAYFDLQGRKLSAPVGLCIKQVTFKDGTCQTNKFIAK